MTITEYEAALFSRIVNAVTTHKYSAYIDSIVLTGSFGRGEPTYVINGSDFVLKSDVELALVFTHRQKRVYKLIEDVKKDFKEDLNFMTIRIQRVLKKRNFNYELKSPKYNTIFMYDFYNGSKILYGPNPNFGFGIAVEKLDPYEAKRIVANRIAEMQYLSEHNDPYLLLQWKCKIILAVASAWLILKKLYVSSYHGQQTAIHEHESEFTELFGHEFLELYDRAFAMLRTAGDPFTIDDAMLREAVRVFYRYFRTQHQKKSGTTTFARHLKFILKYIRKEKRLNIIDLEDRILENVLHEYCDNSPELAKTAHIWHDVLY